MARLISTTIDTGLTGDYPSHNAAIADYYGSSAANIVTANEYWECHTKATTGVQDTTAVTVSGMTTDTSHTVKVGTWLTDTGGDGQGGSYRHKGVLPAAGKKVYAMEAKDRTIFRNQNYTYLIGMGMRAGNTGTATTVGIQTTADRVGNHIAYNVLTRHPTDNYATATNVWGIWLDRDDSVFVYGNIIYDINVAGKLCRGFEIRQDEAGDVHYIYANVVVDSFTGYRRNDTTGSVILKDNVAFNCSTACYTGTFTTGTEYNAYSSGSDPGTNGVSLSGYTGAQVFADYANDDFAPNFAGPLMAAGKDISTDINLPVTTDYRGNIRPFGLGYECGAVEYIPPAWSPGMRLAGADIAEYEDLLDKFSRETFRRMKRGSPLPPPVTGAHLPEPVTGAHLPPVVPDV